MGAVYKVRQKELDRWAALKVLPDDVAHDPTFAERFQREARALALLGHQHIVIVYEFGQRDGVYFLLMEFIDGVTLRQAIRAGRISSADALGIVAQICDALQFAHEENVIHRDIKPENILLDKRGRVKIADFGLAKLLGRSSDDVSLTGTHQVMGTPVYMAPEQMEGTRGVDHRADIFSLGVVFYELLTGELPLGRFDPPSQKHGLDTRLDEVVLRTLEKEPNRRYQQASDIKVDVESIQSQPVAARAAIGSKTKKRSLLEKVIAGSIFTSIAFTLLTYLVTSYLDHMNEIANKKYREQLSNNHNLFLQQIQDLKLASTQHNGSANQPQGIDFIPIPTDTISDDPLLKNAVVQFTSDGTRLNPAFDPQQFQYGAGGISPEQRQTLNRILTRIHHAYLDIERRNTTWQIQDDGTSVATINGASGADEEETRRKSLPFEKDIAKLEDDLWTEIDETLPVHLQKFLREKLPLFADIRKPVPQVPVDGSQEELSGGMSSMGMASSMMGSMSSGSMGPGMGMPAVVPPNLKMNLRYEQLLGWKSHLSPVRVTIGRQGKWFRWTIEAVNRVPRIGQGGGSNDGYAVSDSGEAPGLPAGLRRFWRTKASPPTRNEPSVEPNLTIPEPGKDEATPAIIESDPEEFTIPKNLTAELTTELREFDGLRAGLNTPCDKVEQQTNRLLEQFHRPADKGRIHWQAAHVYGQSDIRGHAGDVTRHAKEGLKYERDPVQRGWLFMYLGDAATVRDGDPKTFVERRVDAARWYLKGYAELRPFNLPDRAPELPQIEKVGGEFNFSKVANGEIDPEQVAAEVRQAAQIKRRDETTIVRELVHRRETYLSGLRELYRRLHELYDKDSVAQDKFREIATEVLHEQAMVEDVTGLVWPELRPRNSGS